MTEVDDSLTAMDWLLNPSFNLLADLKLNKYMLDCFSSSEALDFQKEPAKSKISDNNQSDKPPYSYAELIKKAIESSPQHKMTLNEIYEWIREHFPYYRDGHNGWKVITIL